MINHSKGENWTQLVHQLNSALQKARPTTPTKGPVLSEAFRTGAESSEGVRAS